MCKILYTLIIGFFFSSSLSQDLEFDSFSKKLPEINIPFDINMFEDYSPTDSSINQVKEYNLFVLNTLKEYKVKEEIEEGKYEVKRKRTWNKEEKRYETYNVLDSNLVQFIGKINFPTTGVQVLVKIKKYSGGIAYYNYSLVSFNEEGQNVSRQLVFQLIDEKYTFDEKEFTPRPSITSVFKDDGSIVVTWDGGYNSIVIETVRLNDEGVFYVEKSESIKVRN